MVSVPAAIFAGSDAALALEYLGEVALVVEAAFLCDFRHKFVGRLQQPACGVDADGGDIATGRDAECAREAQAESCRGDADQRRQLRKRDVVGVVRVDEFRHWLQHAVPVVRAVDLRRRVVDARRADDLAFPVE